MDKAHFTYIDLDVMKYVTRLLTALNEIGFVSDKEYPGIPVVVAMETTIVNDVAEAIGKVKFDYEQQEFVFIPYMQYEEDE